MNIRRSKRMFEQAMRNADCPLFEAIARWVVQDDGYLSMKTLTDRIKLLEEKYRKSGLVLPELKNE